MFWLEESLVYEIIMASLAEISRFQRMVGEGGDMRSLRTPISHQSAPPKGHPGVIRDPAACETFHEPNHDPATTRQQETHVQQSLFLYTLSAVCTDQHQSTKPRRLIQPHHTLRAPLSLHREALRDELDRLLLSPQR